MKEAVVVIGSGFGGLAAAIRLQALGREVTLVERRPLLGGRAYQFQEKGYTFDMGPSLVTLPSLFRNLFAAGGERLEDHVALTPLHPYYRIYFPDGGYAKFIDYSGDAAAMRRELEKFDPADGANYDRFLARVKPIFDAGYTDYGRKPFMKFADFLAIVPRMARVGAVRSIDAFMRDKFRAPQNRQALGFQSLFLGGNPKSVPAIYAMLPAIERHEGVWYAKGGMYSLIAAMGGLFRRLGGALLTGVGVEEITVDGRGSRRRATGVRLAGGRLLTAAAVVSNADTSTTYTKLLRPEHRRVWTDRRIAGMKRGMSLFLVYLGSRRRFPKLAHHTLIFGPGYGDALEAIFKRRELPKNLHIYAHAPTRTDDTMAPPGGESMYFLLPVPLTGPEHDWTILGPKLRERLIDFLEKDFALTGLRESLEVVRTFSPADFADQLAAYEGAAFSFEPSLRQSAYFRPHNRSEEIPNLYLVGAGTHPGAGVPGVMLSAAIAADLITGTQIP